MEDKLEKINSDISTNLIEKNEVLYKKGLFLLKFDWDMNAEKNGLLLIKKAADLGYKPAISKIEEIKSKNSHHVARALYEFVYGQKLI